MSATYVIKLGGNALDDLGPDAAILADLAVDVAELVSEGVRVVLVHGGGPQIKALLARTGEPSHFDGGLRVTPPSTMDLVAMALDQVNGALVAACNRHGLRAVGVSGVDGGLFTATAQERWGRVGDTPRVNPDVLRALWQAGFTPVVSPIALDEAGVLLNCNADTSAGALAGALDAEALVLLSDIDQLRADPDDAASALARVHVADVDAMIASGAAREGMRPKMAAARDALDAGARRVVLANGTRPHALAAVLGGTIPTTEVLP